MFYYLNKHFSPWARLLFFNGILMRLDTEWPSKSLNLTTDCFVGVGHHLGVTCSAFWVVVRIPRIPFTLNTAFTTELVTRPTDWKSTFRKLTFELEKPKFICLCSHLISIWFGDLIRPSCWNLQGDKILNNRFSFVFIREISIKDNILQLHFHTYQNNSCSYQRPSIRCVATVWTMLCSCCSFYVFHTQHTTETILFFPTSGHFFPCFKLV